MLHCDKAPCRTCLSPGPKGDGIQVHQSFGGWPGENAVNSPSSIGVSDRRCEWASLIKPQRTSIGIASRTLDIGKAVRTQPEAATRQGACLDCCLHWSAKISSSHPFDSAATNLASGRYRETLSNSESSNQQFNCRLGRPTPLVLEKSISVPAPLLQSLVT